MEDPGKLGGKYKKLKDIEAERRVKIENSGFKVIQGGVTDAPDAASSKEQEEIPNSFRFSDDFFKKPFNPKEPGILDEGE